MSFQTKLPDEANNVGLFYFLGCSLSVISVIDYHLYEFYDHLKTMRDLDPMIFFKRAPNRSLKMGL